MSGGISIFKRGVGVLRERASSENRLSGRIISPDPVCSGDGGCGFLPDTGRIDPPALLLPDASVHQSLPDSPPSVTSSGSEDAGKILMLTIDSISPNPSQPRKVFEGEAITRLADSIRCYGILQPLTVRVRTPYADHAPCGVLSDDQMTAESEVRPYELIAGERRLRAAQMAGLERVPCILIEADDRRSAELALIENVQRENLNLFEQAGAIAALIDIYSLTQEQVAKQLSASQSYVANKLRILRLTEPERKVVLDNHLTERHARAVLRLDTPEERLEALEIIARRRLNVAAAEQYVDRKIEEDRKRSESESEPKGNPPVRKMILKDIRIFYNTIDRALDTVREAGLAIQSSRRERGDCIELVIEVPKCYEKR